MPNEEASGQASGADEQGESQDSTSSQGHESQREQPQGADSQAAGDGQEADEHDEDDATALRNALRAERDARRRLERQLKRSTPTKSQTTDIETMRRDLEADAHSRVVRAEVRASAASRLQDPSDAVRFLDLSKITVDDNGDVDQRALEGALDDLLKARPYLAKQNGSVDSHDMRGGNKPIPSKATFNDIIRAAARG